jgi:hypothetical protein
MSHKVILEYNDRQSGDWTNAKYHVSLPSSFKNNDAKVLIESLHFDDVDKNFITDKQILQIHIPELQGWDSYDTSTNKTTPNVITTKSSGNTLTGRTANDTCYVVDTSLLKNNTITVKMNYARSNIKEFPPAPAVPSNIDTLPWVVENQPYGNGNYIITASSKSSPSSTILVFDGSSNTGWTSLALYNASTGLYTGSNTTNVAGSNVAGEWVQVKMPYSFTAKNFTLIASSLNYQYPNTFTLAGSSNDGASWGLLESKSNLFWTQRESNFDIPANSNAYDTYHYILSRSGNSNTSANRQNATLFDLYFKDADSNRNPPVAIVKTASTQQATLSNQYYGNGMYQAKMTNPYINGQTPWVELSVFSKSTLETSFGTSNISPYNGCYNSNTGYYVGSLSTNGVLGDYVEVETPSPLIVSSYALTAQTLPERSPKDYTVFASQDGSNWTLIDQRSGITWTGGERKTFAPYQTNTPYQYFRVVVGRNNAINNNNSRWVSIREIQLYGIEQPFTNYTLTLNIV